MKHLKTVNTVEIRYDNPDRVTTLEPLQGVDEILIGDWFHMERMNGTNRREWSIILTDQRGNQLNLSVTEKDGLVKNAIIVEDGWNNS